MKSFLKFTKSITQNDHFNPIVRLLGAEEGIEITQYEVGKKSMFFLKPSLQPDTYEFYYIVTGSVSTQDKIYNQYDYYEAYNINETVKLTALEDTVILYISTKTGEFKEAGEFNEELVSQLNAIQEKDHYTFEHCRRVKRLVLEIADALNLSGYDQKNLALAAYFHDIGKIKISDTILNKPDKLTDDEYNLMKMHVSYSYDMIQNTLGKEVADIIITHHERLDGSGYPNGVSNIPLLGRLLAVADSYDAMTSHRVYHSAMTHDETIKELLSLDHQYDISIVQLLDKIKNHA